MNMQLDPILIWIREQPWLAAWIVFGVVLIIANLTSRRRKQTRHDPQRMFTVAQRTQGFARAGRRCEYDGALWFLRCKTPATHGDHFYPWAKGGASSMVNFVAACARHNLSKGATLPSWFQERRIRRRRRRYFPAGTPRVAGEWFGKPRRVRT